MRSAIVLLLNFADLIVEGCVMTGFLGNGLEVFTNAAGITYVRDCVVRNNGSAGALFSSGATQRVFVERTALLDNGAEGLFVNDPAVHVTARSCVAAGNAGDGFVAGGFGELTLEKCISSGNGGHGVAVLTSSTVRVSNCTVTDNGAAGLFNNSGTFESRRNNTVAGNSPDVSGTVTPISGQ